MNEKNTIWKIKIKNPETNETNYLSVWAETKLAASLIANDLIQNENYGLLGWQLISDENV